MSPKLKAALLASALALTPALAGATCPPSFTVGSLSADADCIWRDYNTDGVSASGPYAPQKSQIRQWSETISAALGSATLASASTTDLGSVPQAFINISGTTAITSFGSSAAVGQIKILTFSGTPKLTYNAASMVLPGGADITTTANSTAIAIYLGSGNWSVLSYTPGYGAPGSNTPQVTAYSSGSGTYTTPVGALYLEVEMVGGGSGGGGSGTTGSPGGAGGAGGATTFGSAFLTASGGAATPSSGPASYPSAATATGGDFNLSGNRGKPGSYVQAANNFAGAPDGAASFFGAGGNGGALEYNGTSWSATSPLAGNSPGSGGGAGGAGTGGVTVGAGWGGNSGAYLRKIITSPASTYAYSVGTGGSAGSAGTSGNNGAAGAAGRINIVAKFQ